MRPYVVYMSVNDLIEKLQQLSADGYGDVDVGFTNEYDWNNGPINRVAVTRVGYRKMVFLYSDEEKP